MHISRDVDVTFAFPPPSNFTVIYIIQSSLKEVGREVEGPVEEVG